MARRIALIALLLAGGAVLFLLQRHKVSTPITPRPMLYLVADAERDAERLPLDATRVSDQQEMRVGAQMANNICMTRGQHETADIIKIRNYVTQVGQSLPPNVLRTGIRYTFCVEDSPYFVNAYALPGGYVVIGRGLLSILESEDELAFILGHEIAHVDERHAIERVQYQLASRRLGLESLYQLGSPIQFLVESGYTKEQEQEADRDGIGLAHDAGYSVEGAVDAMRRFEKMDREMHSAAGSPVEEFASVPFQSLEEYFRSHPPAAERRQAPFQQIISSRGWNDEAPVRPYALRPIFLSEQAAALDTQGRFAKSIARYEEAIRLDSTYQPALDGLALAYWRSGDAAAAERAAIAAADVHPDQENLRILARSGSVADREAAIKTLIDSVLKPEVSADIHTFDRVQLNGLASGRASYGVDGYRAFLSGVPVSAQLQATVRTEMAWWMYRAGNLQDAVAELEAAHQSYPNFGAALIWKAWLDSDFGHQADAENDVASSLNGGIGADATISAGGSAPSAVRAVVSWRTDKKDLAKSQFQSAAETDPVWMVHNWVANTFSKPTAAILFQLQALEAARREEEARKKREAASR